MHKLLDYVKEIGALRFLQVRKEDGGLARSYRSFPGEHESDGKPFPGDGAIYLGETFFVRSESNCGTVELLHNWRLSCE